MTKLPIPFPNPHTYVGHSGVDFPQPKGTPIRASGPGVVTTRALNLLGGFYVWVQYDDGPRVGYHHMDSHRGVPKKGTRVTEGTLLGYVGKLGLRSTGYHLHSEVKGHGTTAGYWRFFDRERVVGQPAPSGGGSTPAPIPVTPEEEEDMYIANVKGGNFYLVIGTKAHALGRNSGARESGIPVINYPDDWAVKQLKTVVSGIA